MRWMLGKILRKIRPRGPRRSGDCSTLPSGGIEGHSTTILARRDLAKLSSHGPEMKALFRASNMAAGPCLRAAELDGQVFEVGAAPIPPFEDCPHPDQCACMYQARLVLD
jgi:hypothetical protein